MVCRLIGAKPLSESILKYCWLDPQEQTSVKFQSDSYIFIQENAFGKVVCKTVSILSRPQWVNIWQILIRKQSEMQGCMICIVAIDAMVLKHKAISNHSAASVLDRYFISNKST